MHMHSHLHSLMTPSPVRHVGAGNRGVRTGLSSRISSMDDLGEELETRSLAPSVAASHSSHVSGSLGAARGQGRRRAQPQGQGRESSKESSTSESEELAIGEVPQPHRLDKMVSRCVVSHLMAIEDTLPSRLASCYLGFGA